jgi:hypothetical protein
MNTIPCAHCGGSFTPDPRVKNQRYCSAKPCRRSRKNAWQRKKLAVDPDYRANQRDCQKEWHKRPPGYYRKYRKGHPDYAVRNAFLQGVRNARRPHRLIARMDALKPAPIKAPGAFYLIPMIAKMDASAQKVILIPAG